MCMDGMLMGFDGDKRGNLVVFKMGESRLGFSPNRKPIRMEREKKEGKPLFLAWMNE